MNIDDMVEDFTTATQPQYTQAAADPHTEELIRRAERAADEDLHVVIPQEPSLTAGMTWENADECRLALRMYAIENRFKFDFAQNTTVVVTATCPDTECAWRVYCRKHPNSNSFGLRKMNLVHTCRQDLSGVNPNMNCKLICRLLLKEIRRSKRSFTAREVKNEFWNAYGVELSYQKCWRSLVQALEEIHGSYEESFKR